MEIIPVNFRFKGARDYVHGTDMYDQLLPLLMERLTGGTVAALKMTIRGVMRRQGRLLIESEGQGASRPDGVKAEFCLTRQKHGIFGWLTEDSREILDRYSYDEAPLLALCSVRRNHVALEYNPGYTPIEVLVAMNKLLMETLFPDEKGKWFFTRLQLARPLEPGDMEDLVLEHEMSLPGNALTRTRIRSGREGLGSIFFSAVK